MIVNGQGEHIEQTKEIQKRKINWSIIQLYVARIGSHPLRLFELYNPNGVIIVIKSLWNKFSFSISPIC